MSSFGAVGDGTTNDSAAVQAAVAACVLAGGGKVAFPTGHYRVQGIDLAEGVHF